MTKALLLSLFLFPANLALAKSLTCGELKQLATQKTADYYDLKESAQVLSQKLKAIDTAELKSTNTQMQKLSERYNTLQAQIKNGKEYFTEEELQERNDESSNISIQYKTLESKKEELLAPLQALIESNQLSSKRTLTYKSSWKELPGIEVKLKLPYHYRTSIFYGTCSKRKVSLDTAYIYFDPDTAKIEAALSSSKDKDCYELTLVHLINNNILSTPACEYLETSDPEAYKKIIDQVIDLNTL